MIDVLERIIELREQKHWTEYQLAERSGLTQSTISSWYRKHLLPSISSLEKICTAFGITISQFFDDNDGEYVLINPMQKELLDSVEKLDSLQIKSLVDFLNKI